MNNRNYLRNWLPFLILVIFLAGAPLFFNDFRLNQLGKFLCWGIVAIGLDLIWGYGGMLSLGQGLFFSLGAYCFAMYLKLESTGFRLPDFMVWSGRTELPAIWLPFQNPVFAVAMVIILPTLLAMGIGYLVFRSRVQNVYFSIITQALTLMFSLLFVGQQPITGGTNGITNLSTIFGLNRNAPEVQHGIYWVTLLVLVLGYIVCQGVVRSRFGRLLMATRDDEARVRFLGYDPVVVKTLSFGLSATLAGIAGALFVSQVGIISPANMETVASIEFVIMVAVGGRGTLLGALVGALLVSWGKSYFSESYPTFWQFLFGSLFIAVVLLFPKGIVGSLSAVLGKFGRNRATATLSPDTPTLTLEEVSHV